MAITPNQSYLVKQMQWKIAAAFGIVMNDLGGNIKTSNYAYDNPGDLLRWPVFWRKENQYFKTLLKYNKKGLHASEVSFTSARWDSQASDLNYGKKSIDQSVNEQEDAKTKVIYNKTTSPIHVAYEESVELTNSFSTSITKGCVLDMTEDKSADVSATVGAEYAGVKAEATVSAHYGVSKSKSESSEQGKEESEEGTKSESLAIDFDAEPESYYLVEITKKNERTSQPFDINGVMDFDIHLNIYSWYNNAEHHWTRDLPGIDAFDQYVHGFDTNHPEMAGYWDKAPEYVKKAVAFVMNPENRRIQVSGISHGSLDSNADYTVEQLGDHIPDSLADLPEVNAEDA